MKEKIYNAIASYWKEISNGFNKLDLTLVFGIMLLNILFRLPYLNSAGLWYDEVFSVYHSQFTFKHVVGTCSWDISAPGYYYFLNIWIKFFGISEYSVRMLSVVQMSFASGIIFLSAKKFFTLPTAIWASILFLASNEIYHYSHETRTYALLCLFSSASIFLLFTQKKHPSTINAFLFGFILGLMFLSHYLSLFYCLLSVLLFLTRPTKPKHIFSLIIGFLTIIMHWIWRIIEIIKNGSGTSWNKYIPNTTDLYNALKDSYGGYIALAIAIALSITMVMFYLKKEQSVKKMAFELLALKTLSLGTILIFFFISKVKPIWLPRYFIYSAIPAILFISLALQLMPVKNYLKHLIVLLVLIVGVLNVQFKIPPKMDYKNGVKYIKDSLETENSVIVVQTADLTSLFAYYYDTELFKSPDLEKSCREKNIFTTYDSIKLSNARLDTCKRVIHTQTFSGGENSVVLYLNNNFRKVSETKKYTAMKITVYEK